MLLTGSSLINTPIMSLQTGAELARTSVAVINPHNLSIIAYEVHGPHLDTSNSILRINDIRELSSVGMIIDSSDEFIEPHDVVRLEAIYNLHFTLTDKPVFTPDRKKVGKVIEYTLDDGSFIIQQLTVKKPLFKSLNDTELLVHRSQIVEVTDEAIVIKDAVVPKAIKSTPGKHAYVNPFRQAPPQSMPEGGSASSTID